MVFPFPTQGLPSPHVAWATLQGLFSLHSLSLQNASLFGLLALPFHRLVCSLIAWFVLSSCGLFSLHVVVLSSRGLFSHCVVCSLIAWFVLSSRGLFSHHVVCSLITWFVLSSRGLFSTTWLLLANVVCHLRTWFDFHGLLLSPRGLLASPPWFASSLYMVYLHMIHLLHTWFSLPLTMDFALLPIGFAFSQYGLPSLDTVCSFSRVCISYPNNLPFHTVNLCLVSIKYKNPYSTYFFLENKNLILRSK